MDTKWKSSKPYFLPFAVARASLAGAVAAGLAASVIFLSLFPFFRERAQAAYTDPLISSDFVNDLLSVNYVQYKYLREKTDQTQYSYSDLYLHEDLETADGESVSSDEEALRSLLETWQDPDSVWYGYAQDGLSSLEAESEEDFQTILRHAENIVSEQKTSLESTLSGYEEMLSSYGGSMDYYVEDLDSGTVLSNSGSSLPGAVARDGEDSDGQQDYVYYVSLEYDSAGNVGNVSVRCPDHARQFINTVQSAGHERQLFLNDDGGSQELDPDGQASTYRVYDEYGEQYAILRLTLSHPTDMRVIYGLTQEQYDALFQSGNPLSDRVSLYLAMENSYHEAGVAPVYLFLLFLCACAGLIWKLMSERRRMAALYEESQASEAGSEKRRSRGLYIEAAAILVIMLVGYSVYPVVRFTAEYENGIFLQSIRTGMGGDGKLFRIPLDRAALFLFLAALFAAAFLIGSGLAGIRRGSLKERSLICKYWHRVYSRVKKACRDFYTDLIRYDIGTDANRIILKVLGVNFFILMLICCFWFAGILGLVIYTVIVYFILKKYVMGIQEKYRKLLRATSSIAQGNLDTALSEDFGVFESYKSQLRRIQSDFKRAVEEEVRSQRMKTELITNVSHDLKTPLTAIITYIDLLKEPGVTPEKQAEYLAVLQKKANRLKVLIEDLFEISKASSRAVTLHIVNVDICNLLRQAYLEQEDRISAAGLDFRFRFPEKRVILSLDSQKTYRIFDNLYTNIIKYAMKGTRVYVSLTEERELLPRETVSREGGREREIVKIELKNISASELSVDPNELTERFVRGDGSRNTEGSGLGLAIAKSFTELQGGSMHIEVDGDLFKAVLTFPVQENGKENGNGQMPTGAKTDSPKMAAVDGAAEDLRQNPASPPHTPPAPPAPWNRSSNRFYRKGTEAENHPSSVPFPDAGPSANVNEKPAPQRPASDSKASGRIRSWLRTLWFGRRR